MCFSEAILDAASTAVELPAKKVDKYFIILDMNGLLMGKGEHMFGKTSYHFRHRVDMFLKELANNFNVTLWTCATPRNANTMYEELSEAVKGSLTKEEFKTKLKMVDQDYCEISMVEEYLGNGRSKPNFFKSLSSLFKTVKIPQEASVVNTLLIDDSPLKNLLNNQYNAIHPPSYDWKVEQSGAQPSYLMTTLLPYLQALRNSGLPVQDFCRSMEYPGCLPRVNSTDAIWIPYRELKPKVRK